MIAISHISRLPAPSISHLLGRLFSTSYTRFNVIQTTNTSSSTSIFDELSNIDTSELEDLPKPKADEHRYRTSNFKTSPQKLNLLARQIAGKKISDAIVQMQYSDKRPAKKILSMLALARDHAVRYKGMDATKLVVDEAWVGKGLYLPRMTIHARGRTGIMHHKQAHMAVVLRESDKAQSCKPPKPKKKWIPLSVYEKKPVFNPAKFYNW